MYSSRGGTVGEFSSPGSTFCADSYFGICSTPVLPQYHVKDPGHSAKSAGGRLQLNTHAPYVCGFAWSDVTYGVWLYGVHGTRRDGSSFTWHHVTTKQPHFGGYSKHAIKSLSLIMQQKRSESARQRKIALYRSDHHVCCSLYWFLWVFTSIICIVIVYRAVSS